MEPPLLLPLELLAMREVGKHGCALLWAANNKSSVESPGRGGKPGTQHPGAGAGPGSTDTAPKRHHRASEQQGIRDEEPFTL